jgi:hypothetical protein
VGSIYTTTLHVPIKFRNLETPLAARPGLYWMGGKFARSGQPDHALTIQAQKFSSFFRTDVRLFNCLDANHI